MPSVADMPPLAVPAQNLSRMGVAVVVSLACHGIMLLLLMQRSGSGLSVAEPHPARPSLRAFLATPADGIPAKPNPQAPDPPPETTKVATAQARAAVPATAVTGSGDTSAGFLLGLDETHYHLASELDRRAILVTRVSLPQAGADPQAEGQLLLRVFINEKGTTDRVTVVLNDAATVLEPVAVAVFRDAKFAPGIKNGIAVKSQMLIEVRLHPESPVTP